MTTNIVIPTTIEGEVLDYEGHTIVIRIGDSNKAWRIPLPPDDVCRFDTVPARSLYDDGTPGAMVSMDFATVQGEIQYDTLLGLRAKGNAPGAEWRTLKPEVHPTPGVNLERDNPQS